MFSAPYIVFNLGICVADGVSECLATLDDSVSEEEEEGSFDELTDFTTYLQPGVELSVLNEVRLRRETCHVATLKHLLQRCLLNLQLNIYLVACVPCEQPCENVCFQDVWQNRQPLQYL